MYKQPPTPFKRTRTNKKENKVKLFSSAKAKHTKRARKSFGRFAYTVYVVFNALQLFGSGFTPKITQSPLCVVFF